MRKFQDWYDALGRGAQTAFISIAVFLGLIGLAAAAPDTATPSTTPSPSVTQGASKSPEPEVKKVEERQAVAFTTETRDDGSLPKGDTKVSQEGKDGERTIVYEVTYVDGKETARKQVSDQVTTQPVNKIVLNGTYVAPVVAVPKPTAKKSNCDPNYSGCVPIASDVDCASGSGNGPAYTSGPVRVIGSDIYDLDSDGDGYGCE